MVLQDRKVIRDPPEPLRKSQDLRDHLDSLDPQVHRIFRDQKVYRVRMVRREILVVREKPDLEDKLVQPEPLVKRDRLEILRMCQDLKDHLVRGVILVLALRV